MLWIMRRQKEDMQYNISLTTFLCGCKIYIEKLQADKRMPADGGIRWKTIVLTGPIWILITERLT